jgi:glyoxylase-like metal-dependent hydrolase (beta-lactamase superfamily II)
MLWDAVHPGRPPSAPLADGQRIEVGGGSLEVLHTPGHSPGGCCLHDAPGAVLYSGDTLFNGGPGATGRSFSDFGQIIESIRTRILALPSETVVHTGHGDDTRVGDEAPHLDEWIARGH